MSLPTGDPAALGFDAGRLNRVTTWLERQIDSERLAGASVLVLRHGKAAYLEARGLRDLESAAPFTEDTVVRIYSMTKPVTTVAAMQLYEAGCFQLDDPISRYLPEFADTPVWRGGALTDTEAQASPISVRHLMTHTSGLTYGFMQSNVVDAEYRARGIEFPGAGGRLSDWVERVAELPLICQPGAQWNYSVSTDVLGRLVEVWSGQSLADYLETHVLAPLGMADTRFTVRAEDRARFASLYAPLTGGGLGGIARTADAAEQAARGGLKLQEDGADSRFLERTELYSGGGGLTGTIGDYGRFCQMLLNGGALDGVRILSPATVRYMRTNQLPGNVDMAAMGQPVWSETSYEGIGFGLGFAVVIDPVKAHIITSPGEHHWGGAASTFFWLDPTEGLAVVFFTQLMPSSTYPVRRELRVAVYQALVESARS